VHLVGVLDIDCIMITTLGMAMSTCGVWVGLNILVFFDVVVSSY